MSIRSRRALPVCGIPAGMPGPLSLVDRSGDLGLREIAGPLGSSTTRLAATALADRLAALGSGA